MEASLSAGKGDGRRVIRAHTGGRLAFRTGVIIFYIRSAQISVAWGLIPPTDEPCHSHEGFILVIRKLKINTHNTYL